MPLRSLLARSAISRYSGLVKQPLAGRGADADGAGSLMLRTAEPDQLGEPPRHLRLDWFLSHAKECSECRPKISTRPDGARRLAFRPSGLRHARDPREGGRRGPRPLA